jgi:NadR type nicotinamide-nucleotide adenylyltransferase
MTRGFLLGKFMPPHLGHLMLCEFAQAHCDALTVLVCTRSTDPIDGDLRFRWMRELLPGTRVVHLSDDNAPQSPSDNPNFWEIWRAFVRRAHPEAIDFIYASEAYGLRLAAEVGAEFVPVDIDRRAVPIAATRVRAQPFAEWQFLPEPVRAHYARVVTVHGPESTGKTTLAKQLAAHFRTALAPEYGRIYCDVFGSNCTAADLRKIVRGQLAIQRAVKRQANRILIQDTDGVTSAAWADMLLGGRPPDLDEVAAPSDFYLLCDIDVAWADDGTRYRQLSDVASRRRFFDICRADLDRRSLPYAIITGDRVRRLQAAIAAIHRQFPELCSSASTGE